jgi:hypothetical protein
MKLAIGVPRSVFPDELASARGGGGDPPASRKTISY